MDNRLAELQRLIDQADHAYYTLGSAIMEDARYDKLREELKQLNPSDPRLTRVGAKLRETLRQKRRHSIPMISQDKAMNREEFVSWMENNIKDFKTVLHASYKMDGLSVSFEYQEGRLVCAVSRGDGEEGEDITANAVKFKNLPAHPVLPDGRPLTGFVRGEVILPTEEWEELDPVRESNPRNMAAGIARRDSGKDSELLQVWAFRLFDVDGHPIGKTEQEQEQVLKGMGFETPPSLTGDLDKVWDFYLATAEMRPKLDYWIDGLVVRLNDLEAQLALGETEHHPRGQVACKFEAESAETVLRKVTLQVGHTGAIAPVGEFDPVRLGGTTVANATLCNWSNIATLGLAVGDSIRVIKAGDIIPRVMEVTKKGEPRHEIAEPQCCPVCAGPVGHLKNLDGEETTALFCLNEGCPARKTGKIDRFLSSLDILGVGESLLEAIVKDLGVLDAADLYTLHTKREALANLKLNGKTRLGEKRADKFLAEIEKRRQLTVPEFLGSIGIPGLGKRRVALIQEAVNGQLDKLEDWFDGKLVEAANTGVLYDTMGNNIGGLAQKIGEQLGLESFAEMGKLIKLAEMAKIPNMAAKIQEDLRKNLPLVRKFLTNGVVVVAAQPKPVAKPGAFTFCITGSLSQPKAHFWKLITDAGHVGTDDFSKAVTHLVAADPNGSSSKLQKARKMGIPILSEQQLVDLLKA